MRSLAEFLAGKAHDLEEGNPREGMLISTISGFAIAEHPMAKPLLDAGFSPGAMGFHLRRSQQTETVR
jgi:ATP-dependent Lhr-like helicase